MYLVPDRQGYEALVQRHPFPWDLEGMSSENIKLCLEEKPAHHESQPIGISQYI